MSKRHERVRPARFAEKRIQCHTGNGQHAYCPDGKMPNQRAPPSRNVKALAALRIARAQPSTIALPMT
jgi:hypothetical protein